MVKLKNTLENNKFFCKSDIALLCKKVLEHKVVVEDALATTEESTKSLLEKDQKEETPMLNLVHIIVDDHKQRGILTH